MAFDAAYYLAQNPDVKAAGIDPYQHYKNFGEAEGRAPSATPTPKVDYTGTPIGPESLGDNSAYINYLTDPNNIDLMAAYTSDANAGRGLSAVDWAKWHYQTYGKYEPRFGGDTGTKTTTPPPTAGLLGSAPNMPPSSPVDQTGPSANALVENRLTGLLDRNSRYIQQARTRGMQQAASRGLLNTSIAAGAAEREAIAAAAPIAGQDAGTFAASDLAYQNYLQGRESTTLAGNVSSNLEQQRINAETALTQMKLAADERMATLNLTAEDRKSVGGAIDGLGQQYMANYTQIFNSPDYATPQDKQRALDSLTAQYQANMNMLSGFYGTKLTWVKPGGSTTTTTTPTVTPDRIVVAREQYGQGFADWLAQKAAMPPASVATGIPGLTHSTNYETAPLAELYAAYQQETQASV